MIAEIWVVDPEGEPFMPSSAMKLRALWATCAAIFVAILIISIELQEQGE